MSASYYELEEMTVCTLVGSEYPAGRLVSAGGY